MTAIEGSSVVPFGVVLSVAVLMIPRPAWSRIVAVVAVAHLTILASVALFPIPTNPAPDGLVAGGLNLVPFATIGPVLAGTAPSEATRLLALNVFVLFPAGLYLPLLVPSFRGAPGLVALAVVGGASIELAQAAVSAMIRFRYRSIDIDDAILNAGGLVLGWIVVRIVLGIGGRLARRT